MLVGRRRGRSTAVAAGPQIRSASLGIPQDGYPLGLVKACRCLLGSSRRPLTEVRLVPCTVQPRSPPEGEGPDWT